MRYKGTGERMPRLLSFHGEKLSSVMAREARAAERMLLRRADSLHAPTTEVARWPPYAPFCSDGIGLSVLPGASRLLGLAPVGCRRLTRSRVNVTAGRIILDAGCVVSAPLPALSGPPLARGHHSEGGGTFLSDPERPPSAVRGLLAGGAHPRPSIWMCRPRTPGSIAPAGLTLYLGSPSPICAGRTSGPPREFDLPPDERRRGYGPRGADRRPPGGLRRIWTHRGRAARRFCAPRHCRLPVPVRDYGGSTRSFAIPPHRHRDPWPPFPARHALVLLLDTPRVRRAVAHRRKLLPSRRDFVDRSRVRGTRSRSVDGIPKRVRRYRRDPRTGERRYRPEPTRSSVADYVGVLRDVRLWLLPLALGGAVYNIVSYFGPLLLVTKFSLAKDAAGVAVAVWILAGAIAAFFFGRVSRRFGRYRTLLASYAGIVLAGLIGGLLDNLVLVIAVLWTLGSALFLTYPGIFAFVSESSHRRLRVAAFGLIFAFQLLGGAAGLFLAGVLADRFGSTPSVQASIPFVVAGVLGFAGFVALFLGRSRGSNARKGVPSVPPL